jgi:DNA invertase Pin-like site-specific DNA recombinase
MEERTMPRLALYARVSTLDQKTAPQLDALRAYATARGFEVVEEYVDHGVSGAKSRRPALDQLLADARRRRFDAVACVKLDRLARSVRHLTEMAGEFDALGVGLIVLDQAIDTTTPAGRLLFHVLGSIAEFERDLISERTRAGMAAARRRGARFGRPHAIRGPDTYKLERRLREGASLRTVAKELGCSAATVMREAKRLREFEAKRSA